jgi:Nitrile hydratase beta subunit
LKDTDSRLTLERSHHDMGGLPAGKVEPTEHDYADWERRVDALSMLMGRKGVTVDERRKNIEMLPPDAYDTMTYYERWVVSLAQALLQRGVITTAELARKMSDVEQRG